MKNNLSKKDIQIKQERKEKFKNILFKILHGVSYALSTCFIIACVVACATQNKNKQVKQSISQTNEIQYVNRSLNKRLDNDYIKQDNINYGYFDESTSEDLSYPIYDDVDNTITLSSNQANNFIWQNFYNYLNTDGYFSNTNISYLSNNYVYDGREDGNDNYGASSDETIKFIYDYVEFNTSQGTEYENNYILIYFDFDGEIQNFSSTLQIEFDSDSIYLGAKTAIELDIQANTSTPSQSIFGGITESITEFINALNEGIESVINVFWDSDNSQLTTFGILSCIVVAVSISYFLLKLLFGLIRLRG